MTTDGISLRGVAKTYAGGVFAVKHIDLDIEIADGDSWCLSDRPAAARRPPCG